MTITTERHAQASVGAIGSRQRCRAARRGRLRRQARADARTVAVVWRRELRRFARSRSRMLISLAQPLLYLVLLGPGLAQLIPASAPGADYRRHLFPGVLLMTIQFAAVVAGSSIAWDREAGFLREMLVAPVRRGALLLGACLGGASMATAQAMVLLQFAGLARTPYRLGMFVAVVGEMALAALALTAFGALLGCVFRRLETFQIVVNLLALPMFFLSGGMFPLGGMPGWVRALSTIDPVTWAVDALRRTAPGAGRADAVLALPCGNLAAVLADMALLALFTVAALTVAGRRFGRVR